METTTWLMQEPVASNRYSRHKAPVSYREGMAQTTYGPLIGREIVSAPPHLLADMNDPARQARLVEEHARNLRKLATAIHNAVSSGATWDEIRDVIEQTIPEAVLGHADGGRFNSVMRAKMHRGDDTF